METLRNWNKIVIIKLFNVRVNDFNQQAIQLIQNNKKFVITLLVIAYFLINYSVLGYSVIARNLNLIRPTSSRNNPSTIAGMSSKISLRVLRDRKSVV